MQAFPISGVRLFTNAPSDMGEHCSKLAIIDSKKSNVRPEQMECT